MRVKITPAHGYIPGHVETTLMQMGVTPPARTPDGTVTMELSEAQIEKFALRGGSHKIERLPALSEAIAGPGAPHRYTAGEILAILAADSGLKQEVGDALKKTAK